MTSRDRGPEGAMPQPTSRGFSGGQDPTPHLSTPPGSAEEQAIKDRIADIVSKRFGGVYTSRAALLDVAEHILPLLVEAPRLAFEEAASDAQHNAVYGDPRGHPNTYDKGWADASFRIAETIRARAQASAGATEGAK